MHPFCGRRGVCDETEFVGHAGSEVTGPAFSPDGTRLYVSSQRGFGEHGYGSPGFTFEDANWVAALNANLQLRLQSISGQFSGGNISAAVLSLTR